MVDYFREDPDLLEVRRYIIHTFTKYFHRLFSDFSGMNHLSFLNFPFHSRQNASEGKAERQLAGTAGEGDAADLKRARSAAASASAMSELAALLQEQGKLSEAEELYRSALDARTGALGAEHPSVGLSASNLSSVLRDQGWLTLIFFLFLYFQDDRLT